MQEGENFTKEQIEDEIRKIKEAHAEDEGTYLSSKLNAIICEQSFVALGVISRALEITITELQILMGSY